MFLTADANANFVRATKHHGSATARCCTCSRRPDAGARPRDQDDLLCETPQAVSHQASRSSSCLIWCIGQPFFSLR
jgi:hypothetical protein